MLKRDLLTFFAQLSWGSDSKLSILYLRFCFVSAAQLSILPLFKSSHELKTSPYISTSISLNLIFYLIQNLGSWNTRSRCVSHSLANMCTHSLGDRNSLTATPSDSVQPDNALLLRYHMSCKETQLWQQLTDPQTWEQELQSSWFLEAAALHVSDTWQIWRGRQT